MNLTKALKSQEYLAERDLSKASIVFSEPLKLSFLNAKKDPRIIARDVQEGLLNYLVGNDPAKWRTNIPSYRAIVYEEVYRDIDIKFYGNNRHLEYDVIVKPGGDPAVVQFLYEGAKKLHVNSRGELEIELEHGKVIQKTPHLYQEIDGNRVQIEGGFKLITETSYSFQVASYDKNRPLVIDPVLQYSTYLGGTTGESASDIAVDSQGNIYVFGRTSSSGFPTENPYQETYGGGTW